MTKTCPSCGATAETIPVTWDDAGHKAEAHRLSHLTEMIRHRQHWLAIGAAVVISARIISHKFFTFKCTKCGHLS